MVGITLWELMERYSCNDPSMRALAAAEVGCFPAVGGRRYGEIFLRHGGKNATIDGKS